MQNIKSLVDKFNKNIIEYKSSAKYNELSCRIEFIDPLLEILGWDVRNEQALPPYFREVIAENYSEESGRPDYSMTLKGVAKFFVEAKKPSVDICTNKDAAFQTRRYGWNARHRIAVLTNFEYLIIYDTSYLPKETDSADIARYRKYHFSEYIEKLEQIKQIISKESIYTGGFDVYVDNFLPIEERHSEQVDEHFLKQINEWRVILSNYLYLSNEKFKSITVLSDVVQEFINQIIFLRICEDRNLPLYYKLKETLQNQNQLKQKLNELFRNADKRYNSGLFEREYIIFDLNNQIIFDIIEKLYYPQSPYLFNIIESNLLGKIYEMFLTEQLVVKNEKIELTKKRDCINRSVVTTPVEIVKYMVNKSLNLLCQNKTPEQLLGLKIADIACGSGIFLTEVFDYLNNYCIQWYLENSPEYLIELNGGRKKLPLGFKKQLMCSCIYGIDIDIHAVEAAKFSLLIKLIEDETTPSVEAFTPILPDLKSNILYGNSLIDERFLENIDPSCFQEIVPFNWSLINEGNLFDLILGNPPYVNTEDMHSLLPGHELQLYKDKYFSAYKQFDKYFIFLERAIDKIKENGLVCYIIPNKFFKIGAGQNLRELISKKNYLNSLDDFGDAQLFSDKTIYSSVILINKSGNERFTYTKVNSTSALWIGEEKNQICIESDYLDNQPWKLSTDINFLNFYKELHAISVPITKYVEIFNGIQTSAESPIPVYWFSQSEIIGETTGSFIILRGEQKFNIEKAILKPFFKPAKKNERGLNSYSPIHTDKWIIFPYDKCGKLFDIATMESKFNGAYEYLLYYYDRLLPKCLSPKGTRDVPNATQETWFQYGRTQSLTAFINTPKLIVGILSKEPMYAFDKNDMLIASGGTAGYCAISLKKDSPYRLEYIQAWLSHPYTEKILRLSASDFEGGYMARGTLLLKTLPFVEIDFNNINQKAIYDNIILKTQRIYSINENLSENPDKAISITLNREKINLSKEIERLIGSIYTSFKD